MLRLAGMLLPRGMQCNRTCAGPAAERMHYIQTAQELTDLGDQLSSAALLAADTEAAGYHRYRDTV